MTPLVLIPGHMCDARLWGPQLAAFSGTRSIHLAEIASADSMEALGTAVLAQAPPHFALAGLSMGGIVAMEVVRQAPGRVERIALLDTNPLPEADHVKAARRASMARAEAGELGSLLQEAMLPLYLSESGLTGPILDLCHDMAMALGPDVFLRQSRALMARPDQQDTLRGLNRPALILSGAQDRLVPPKRAHLMAELMPHARLELIADAGHLPTLEQPEATNAALRRWLED
ncbi:alpha/beta fold hydrolase [Rubellimicrobium rubrum]|uniref:Alpha/beta fold hydrolase n=1 Tax=Rubellimicrobium rubrum TaxID=2585369 RepID=A0A5C4N2Y2_9RHOB|nr:alpha/beta fold hydrolase [Rubellimicrobium rubrum]TNC53044.1 alpha/beta fold hydrolase [Rubellimicrobium rubrum]